VFGEIRLFNDMSQREITAYIQNCAGKTIAGNLWGGEKERTREIGERERETVCCTERVLASVINLTIGQIS
jgi:hypothetical protein